LSGPQGCGKNLVQEQIITPILGGRIAEPYRYAVNRTQFNQNLFKAAHWMIADQKRPADRSDMREFIRRLASNEYDSWHGKNKEAITLPITRRMSVSCNEEEADLKIIPSPGGLEDKLLLLRYFGRVKSALTRESTSKFFWNRIRPRKIKPDVEYILPACEYLNYEVSKIILLRRGQFRRRVPFADDQSGKFCLGQNDHSPFDRAWWRSYRANFRPETHQDRSGMARQQLTPEQCAIARAKDTEPAFCGKLLDNHREGIYHCICCRLPLLRNQAGG
jgi:hypothetical protein